MILKLIDDHFFFNSIGFDDVVAADVSSYENAEYVFNLNNEFEFQFDIILGRIIQKFILFSFDRGF